MKRFLIFMYPPYYPSGGINDLVGTADTIEEINNIIEVEMKRFFEDFQDQIYLNIFDTKDNIKISDGDNGYRICKDIDTVDTEVLSGLLERINDILK